VARVGLGIHSTTANDKISHALFTSHPNTWMKQLCLRLAAEQQAALSSIHDLLIFSKL